MRLILLILLFGLSSCISPLEKGKIDISLKSIVNSKAKPEISNVILENDQLKISGANFNNLKTVKINSQNLSVISNSGSLLILSASSAVTLALNTILNLVVETASGATSVAVTFNLVDGSVTASKIGDGEIGANHLSSMGASSGEVMMWNGTAWIATALSGLTYLGEWDATTTAPAVSTAGEYYIVSTAGTTDLSGHNSWAIGDWAIYDGVNWAKIDNSTGVKSFNGRSGLVTSQANDYTWNQIDKTISSLNDIADVDTTGASVNDVLKWDGSKWIVASDETVTAGSVTTSAIADGTIQSQDLNAAVNTTLTQVSTNTSDIATNTSDISTNASAIATNASNISTNATSIAGHTTSISNLASTKADKTITVNGQALNANVSLDSDDIAQGGVNLYFSDTLARTAAVIDSMAGAQTNQAPSVDAVKNYISTQTSAITSSQWLDSGSDIYFNAGNVGIGKSSPELELEVVGDISFLNSVGASIPADSILVMKICPTGWTDVGATGAGPASATCDGTSCRRCQSPTNSTAVPSSAIFLFEQCPAKWTYLSKGSGPGAAGFNMPYSACQAPATTAVLPLGSKIIAESCPSQWTDLGETQSGPLVAACGAGNCHVCEVPGSVISSIVQTNSDILSLQPNSGNVGIGIINPTAKLDIFDGFVQVARIENDSTSRGHFVFKRGDGLGANASINSENTGSNDVSALTFHIASTERMRIRNDGRVIASSFQGDGSNLTGVNASSSSNTGDVTIAADSDANASGAINFNTAGTTKMSLTNSGNLGIGNSSPTNSFTIGSNLGTGYAISANSQTAYGQTLQTSEAVPSSNAALWVRTTPDGGITTNTLFRVQNNGNVGIGTTSPTSKLHLSGESGSNNIWIDSYGGTAGMYTMKANGTKTTPSSVLLNDPLLEIGATGYGATAPISTSAAKILFSAEENWTDATGAGSMRFHTRPSGSLSSSIERMRIDPDGKVGIGTTTPSAKLDVNGDAHFSNMTFYDTSVAVPMSSYVPINLSSASSSLVDGNIYRIQLNVTSTATKTGSVYIVYQTAPATWALKQVSANGDTSNHPLLRINVAGNGLEVFHNHSSTYSIHAAVKTMQTGNIDNTSPTYFGLEGVISNYTGNIGIGTDLPKQKLHISGSNSSQVVRIDNTNSTVARYPQFQTVNYRGAAGAGSGAFSFYNSNGSIDTPSAMLQNEQVGIITAYARGTTSFVKSSEIIFGTAENISDTSSAGNIRFLTTDVGAVDPTEKMRVTDTGKIGVGTNAPIEKFHVSGGNIRITSNTTMTSPGVSGGLQIFNSQSANNDYLNIGWAAEDVYALQSADASTHKNIALNPYGGNVGVGTLAPAQKLDVYGNIAVSGSTVHTSDKRFKKDIKVIDHALSKIRKLNGVEFVWRTEEFRERNFKEGLDVGLIAQNVLDVFPEVVEQDANGYYSVAYSKLIGPVIEATKELDHNLEVYKLMSNGLEKKVESNSREIASLKEDNENLQKKVESLEERILRLEKLLSR